MKESEYYTRLDSDWSVAFVKLLIDNDDDDEKETSLVSRDRCLGIV